MKYWYKDRKPRERLFKRVPLKYAVVFGLNGSTTHVSLYAQTRTFSMAKQIVALVHEQHPQRKVWILKTGDLAKLD